MESEQQTLKVCVCGAAENQVTFLLQALADGQMFGPTQPLKLTLHDAAEKACEVVEEALDLRDACYPLVIGVESKTDIGKSLCGSDIILLVLQTTALDHVTSAIADYAEALNKIPRTKQKAVIVVSYHAVPVAGILCALAPQLSHHLVTAVELPALFLKHSQMGRGGLLLAKTVSEHVSCWWSALLANDTISRDARFQCVPRFQSVPSMHVACLLPLSMRVTAVKDHTTSFLSEEGEQFKHDLHDFSVALKRLQISDSQLFSSAQSCQL